MLSARSYSSFPAPGHQLLQPSPLPLPALARTLLVADQRNPLGNARTAQQQRVRGAARAADRRLALLLQLGFALGLSSRTCQVKQVGRGRGRRRARQPSGVPCLPSAAARCPQPAARPAVLFFNSLYLHAHSLGTPGSQGKTHCRLPSPRPPRALQEPFCLRAPEPLQQKEREY